MSDETQKRGWEIILIVMVVAVLILAIAAGVLFVLRVLPATESPTSVAVEATSTSEIQTPTNTLQPTETPSPTLIPPSTNMPTPLPSTDTPLIPTATATPAPPTDTPLPPTNTPVPPTATPPPTNTPVPSTVTLPPTTTPVPPTNTPAPPTATLVPPTNTPPPPPQFPWHGQVANTFSNCALTLVMGLTLDQNGGIAGDVWVHYWADGWEGIWTQSSWGVDEGYEGLDDSKNWDGVLGNYPRDGTWYVCVAPAQGSWDCISTTVIAQTVADPCTPDSGGAQILRIVFQQN